MPPTLSLLTSDRAEQLAARLAADLACEPLSPFEEDVVVVQSQGTGRWLRNELATRLGCAASVRFPFPAGFCRSLAHALSGDDAAVDEAFTREALTWRILELLERDIAQEPAFGALQAFDRDRDARMRLGLAARLASRFDDYQLYRAETLLAWERGELATDSAHERWQAELWRRLCGDTEPRHLARWFTSAIERLESADASPAGLPRRISVFGISTLPPLFTRLLHAAGRFVPVRMYVTAPPRATWLRHEGAANPLFTAFGATSRELLTLCDGPTTEWIELHDERDAATSDVAPSCLAQLQADIREGVVRDRTAENGSASGATASGATASGGTSLGASAYTVEQSRPTPDARRPTSITAGDRSLTLHACHSELREMEVLRDQLFAAFEADPTLRPHDVLVMVPDVPAYAPLAEAVFGVGEPELPRIPYRVADRPFAQESSLAGAMLRMVRLVGARWTAAEVLELLDVPAVRRAAGVSESGAERIVRWIEETGIRWARDGAMRRDVFGLPAVEANSWRTGLDRLLMGYAVGPEDALVGDVLPQAGHTIGDPETLGAFAHWVARLFETLDDWRTPRSLQTWSAALREAVDTLLKADDDGEAESLTQLLEAIDGLATLEGYVGSDRALDLAVVRDWLERTLGDDSRGTGFLTGGMTICALKPMRAIPFRVIAVLGLDDASFPRSDRRAGYDLLQAGADRREGDPDRRADDRQLFLDTLLAARERLILSYVGRSARNNAERAVSVVVAELLDHLDRSFTAVDEDGKSIPAREAITFEHKLQPFSKEYYQKNSKLFSYSQVNARALAAAAAAEQNGGVRLAAAPFATGAIAVPDAAAVPLPTPDPRLPTSEPPTPDSPPPTHSTIHLDDLIAAWSNPSRFFCERTLGLRLPGEDASLDDCEPLEVDGLTKWAVNDRILQRHLAGDRTLERERREAVARGELPPGALTGPWFDKLDADLAPFLERIGRPAFDEPEMIRIDGDGWTITGRVDGLHEHGRMQLRAGKCRNRDQVRAWVTHVVLSAARGAIYTHVHGTDAYYIIDLVDDARVRLEELVAGYRAALAQPLPLFEGASHAYVEQKRKLESGTSRARKDPLDCAREKFRTAEFSRFTDDTDPYVALCWRGRDPFGEPAEFQRWSEQLWVPLLEARQDGTAQEAEA